LFLHDLPLSLQKLGTQAVQIVMTEPKTTFILSTAAQRLSSLAPGLPRML
jgi:hypothetical protein